MSQYILIQIDQDLEGRDVSKLQLEFNSENLDEVVMYLDMFLKGSGFVYTGELGVVEG